MGQSKSTPEDDKLRDEISKMLSDGIDAEVWPRAETTQMIDETILRLRTEAKDNLTKKLVIAGFTDYTVEADEIEQPCETCMYYLVHRKFCDLPELMLPVEAEWSCKLWRI